MIEDAGTKKSEEIEVEVVTEEPGQEPVEAKEPEMSKEEALANVAKQLDEQGLKLMPVGEVPLSFKEDSKGVMRDFESLKNEVLKKKVLAREKSLLIKSKVDYLLESGKVNVDKTEYEKSEVSVEKYTELLTHIVGEIDHETAYFQQFIAEEQPQNIVVPKDFEGDFQVFFKKKVKHARKYAKNIRKDLNVSYSRYCFGFDAQLRRISFIESYLRSIKHEQKKVS